MTYHANKSLDLLQRIISEGSDSSSGSDWTESEQAADSGSGQDGASSGGVAEESQNITADVETDITADFKTGITADGKTDITADGKTDSSLCKESVKGSVMNKMGNTVGISQESEEEVNRKYEQFLKGGQLIENEEENGREVVLEKIEEESGGDSWPVVKEKSGPYRERHLRHNIQEENDSRFEKTSKVESEDSGIKKKTKPRKKKRKVKKAFVVVENGEHEDGKLDSGEQASVNQENCDHQNARYSKKEESTDQDSVSDRQEIMSDQGPSTQNQKRRKLTKRAQIRKFRSLDINPNLFYEERLQQKYEELRELVQTGISQHDVSRQYLRQMEVLRQQYASVSHGIPPSGRPVLRDVSRQTHSNDPPERSESDHAYSTIRMLQVTNQRRFSNLRPRSAAPSKEEHFRDSRSRPKSAAPTRHDQSRERTPLRPGSGKTDSTYSNRNNSNGVRNRSYSPRSRRQNGFSDSPRSKSADSDSASDGHGHQHGGFSHSDYQLKDTDNETIKEWLKRKNVLIRKQKVEERKKKREERKKEQAIAMEKEKKHMESQQKVEVWMKAKRQEAIKTKKEDRCYKKQEMQERTMQDAYKVTMVSGQGFNYPPAPPLYKTKHVVRPGTTAADMKPKSASELPVAGEETADNVQIELNKRRLEEDEKQQATQAQKIQIDGPHPPTTKFVYKRPVLGRVRLRVRQQTPDKNSEQAGRREKKLETQVKREEIKVRKSYDEWLKEKQISNNERRKDLSKQNKMSKSNPELVRRDANLEQRHVTDVDVNKTYNPDDLDELTHRLVSEVLSSLEDEEIEETEDAKSDNFLQVSGSKASLSARPKSAAPAPVPSLQMSKSPRRPASAKPHPKAVKENGEQDSSVPGLKLPFSPELGVPKYVESRQRKLFSPKLWENPEDGMRPEPQGCDATDQNSSTVTEESARDESSAHSHDSQRFKRVSFSETTTVIEEDLPSSESPGTDDPSSDSAAPGVQLYSLS
ncbi:trichohyalin-like isoform X2 [Gigantopelta aegis]|uniref:trichohyalin-like isoform X2 n=1 Tax=Gigantopelta aegis TaxID=1735272 RepID=UPI001B8882BF|nr:trichohyalin-like isoform X2 [Gigantopelta aegis]